MDLSNKVVVIMGASSGIGAATSRLLAKDGAKLSVAARRLDRLNEIKAEFPNSEIETFKADVTKFEDVKNVIDKTVEKFGRIDVLYNNAGIMPTAPLIEGRRDEWQNMLQINIMGVLNGIAAALPYMSKAKSGQIISTDSVAGHVVGPDAAVYSGTKFAVRAIMDGLRMEQAENNIKTTIVSPGSTGTELFNSINDDDQKKFAKDFFENVGGLQPEQIAEAVEFAIGTKNNMSVSEVIIRPTRQTL
ncbi:SDR family oxidoreductase [Companilactobacillus sp.]|jgi:NADP-dependent 3-hydroxy acid dehydrogenase YdfG|uniref:SDR family oxidoreductase n=1 Tax=Companilactobacillus sp. TaxID=2767905 RepID=UPI0025BA18C2|nr:SDR family oxidoreductase [Companilactobacillus sp.]MCH4009148.1 SDR family oxidoreductase [Companilactobacillus sp.]MCH4050673.1 SDR family oxidoreductase [Companilactobacillus sp.]MCH4077090.1 SDR family oxidoreductase [Companilactobacillus sp.]MCH4125666.1 SDR family oxidoreductase [Companilactobacillus sp.]MCI1311375.1 SDR family oxidoreductase [Companilactobacillus sp.]